MVAEFFQDIENWVKRLFKGPKDAYEEILQYAFGENSRWAKEHSIESFFDRAKSGNIKPMEGNQDSKKARYSDWYEKHVRHDGTIPISKMTDEHWADFAKENNWPPPPKTVFI